MNRKRVLAAVMLITMLIGLLPRETSAQSGISPAIASTDAGIELSWEKLESAGLYGIFRRSGEEKWECIAILDNETEDMKTYTDSLVVPGTDYLYAVRYFDRNLQGWSSEAAVQTVQGTWNVTADQIRSGTVLTEAAVEALGTDSFFSVEEISDAVFARMWLKSFKEYCTTPREDLRYIRCLHKDIDGRIKVGELVMNVVVADKVCEIFRKLYDAAFPIESMILVDEFDADDETSIMSNNTSAFNFRMVDNTNQISNHAYGLAIDINPYYNVYYIPSENYIFPYEGIQYLDRDADFPYKVEPGDLCYQLFTEAGFEWGGWWTYNTDYQHFQYVY